MFDRDIQDDLVERNKMELSRDLIKCDECDCLFNKDEATITGAFQVIFGGNSSVICPDCFLGDDDDDGHYDDSMDGDMESGLASAGYGTDEDYGDCDYNYDDCF
jgi:hypothetical protein